ncbi:MAG: phosphatase family protein [Bacteroidota bacterium]|nr:phosphatase family protein [Bacteroidota bacterium]
MIQWHCWRKYLVFFLIGLSACGHKHLKYSGNYAFLLHQWNQIITDIMVGDGFSPLLASRTYAYPNIAAYEILTHQYKGHPSLAGRANQLQVLPAPLQGKEYCFELSAVEAFARVSKKLVYREQGCDELLKKHLAFFKDSVALDDEVFARSVDYGDSVASAIIQWAANDGYAQTKASPKYLFSTEADKWQPTPPEYRSALEPYWFNLRTFTGQKTEDCLVPVTIPFSADKASDFYKLVKEVYDTSFKLSAGEKEITQYWDCNPDQEVFQGHVPVPRRQMSPTSHWMGIVTNACVQSNTGIMETAKCYAMVSIGIADAYICCWKQKYSTNLIRPVTYIKKYIDPDWMPLLVTPPFPEHSSGHSCISMAAAIVLTDQLGNHPFVDSSVVPYGLKAKKFNSFIDAAREAGISRFYGGIHYKTGIQAGTRQGEMIGNKVVQLFKENGN